MTKNYEVAGSSQEFIAHEDGSEDKSKLFPEGSPKLGGPGWCVGELGSGVLCVREALALRKFLAHVRFWGSRGTSGRARYSVS